MLNKTPAYNLKAVLKETGLAADTLRAWERRYGLPAPQRTPGGHRLYSQYDVETIKWLMARQAEGLSISRAVDLWNEQTGSGTDPLAGLAPLAFSSAQTSTADTSLSALRDEWIAACLNFSETAAEQALNKAFSIFPVEAVCSEVIQKGMSEIGDLWYENNASVQQEHFASGLAMRRLDALLNASPAPTRNETVLIGCPPGEWHTLTPLLLALFLRRRGLNVIYLGANVPAERFAETVQKVKANLVILSAQTLINAASLQAAAFHLASQRIPLAFGGRIFTIRKSLAEYIPAHYLGEAVETSIEKIEKLLSNRPKKKEARAVSQEYLAALHAFSSRRLPIENTIREKIQPLAISPENLDTGIHFLGDNIIAALQLGDMTHLTEEMDWLKILLEAHKRPEQELRSFMEIYSNAVDKHINGQGDPIKTWLSSQAGT